MKLVIAGVAMSILSLVVSGGTIAAGHAGSSAATQHSTATTGAAHTAQPTTRSPAHTTGQPNQSCEETPNTPGNSATAPGSAFNPDGKAGRFTRENKRRTRAIRRAFRSTTQPARVRPSEFAARLSDRGGRRGCGAPRSTPITYLLWPGGPAGSSDPKRPCSSSNGPAVKYSVFFDPAPASLPN